MNPGTLPTGIYPTPEVFTNFSTVISNQHEIISRLDNMQPGVITESMSFFIGALVAIAFVIASKIRY